jgi:hypothetical protein
MKSENNIYFIDSSALITINRFYPPGVFPDLWSPVNRQFFDDNGWKFSMSKKP